MEKVAFVQRCIEALNRDQEQNGLPPVLFEKVFLTWGGRPPRHTIFILTDGNELIRYAQYGRGPVVRLTRSILLWPRHSTHDEAITPEDLLPVEHGHELDGYNLDDLPASSRRL